MLTWTWVLLAAFGLWFSLGFVRDEFYDVFFRTVTGVVILLAAGVAIIVWGTVWLATRGKY